MRWTVSLLLTGYLSAQVAQPVGEPTEFASTFEMPLTVWHGPKKLGATGTWRAGYFWDKPRTQKVANRRSVVIPAGIRWSVEPEAPTTNQGKPIAGYLNRERFAALVAEIRQHSIPGLRIRSLSLGDPHAEDLSPADVAKLGICTHLRELSLHGQVPVSDESLAFLRRLTKLEVLEITAGHFAKRRVPSSAGGEPRIRRVSVPTSGAAFEHVAGLTRLRRLWMREADDRSMRHLANLSELEELSIGGRRVTDRGLAVLRGFPKLRALDLGSTSWGPATIRLLGKTSSLHQLKLYRCTASDAEVIAKLKSLARLEIGGLIGDPGLNDDAMRALAEGLSLKTLWLPGSRSVTDVGLAHLSRMSALETLNIKRCTGLTVQGIESVAQKLPCLRALGVSLGREDKRRLQTALRRCRIF